MSLIHLCTAWGSHTNPEIIKDDLCQGRKLTLQAEQRSSIKKRVGRGITRVQGRCLYPPWAQHRSRQYLTCLLKHMSSSQLSSPHGCFFPAQGCPHLSAQLSCAQVSRTTTAGQTPKGIQTDTRACRIAGEVQTLQAGCQNRTERPNCGQGVDTHTSSTREGQPASGDHTGV